MLPALLVLAGLFGLFFLVRVGAARRRALLGFWARHWPTALFALAAGIALLRGGWGPALLFGVCAGASYLAATRTTPATAAPDAEIARARRALGVGADATEQEIRAAYRTKMAQAHPDRGGAHADAARLTAARDLLLKRLR